tara:strand:+ start:9742 stop:10788 length:1047 start_codon:yes stop_codon:yes gene_type:complete
MKFLNNINNAKKYFKNKTVLITGGTGSFGKVCILQMLRNLNVKKIIIFSRDEQKQFEMENSELFKKYKNKLRFFIGDVRNFDRLNYAFENVDIVIHSAALKHVSIAEYNPTEFVETNIQGTHNVIKASISNRVTKTILLSTDKAVNPINLYGATKLAAEKLFIAANNTVGNKKCYFSIVRYGNVIASRGSVLEKFLKLGKISKPIFTITHSKMSRFWISLEDASLFVWMSIIRMQGGEIFVPKIPTMKMVDLAKAINPKGKIKYIGVRPGEKISEVLISHEESENVFEFKEYYKIKPQIRINKIINYSYSAGDKKGKKIKTPFEYNSNNISSKISLSTLKKVISKLNF